MLPGESYTEIRCGLACNAPYLMLTQDDNGMQPPYRILLEPWEMLNLNKEQRRTVMHYELGCIVDGAVVWAGV